MLVNYQFLYLFGTLIKKNSKLEKTDSFLSPKVFFM
jgi:hypothetical protein